MKPFRYNPLLDKTPKGAVSTEETIQIKCRVKKADDLKAVSIYIRDEQYNTIMEKNLKQVLVDDENSYFELKFKIDKIGIYYYHFIVKYYDHTISYGHDKLKPTLGHFSEWQLTVYEEGYKTPDWIKGGIMYQIFPDRFYKSHKYILPEYNYRDRILREDWGGLPNSIYDTSFYSAKDFFQGNLMGIAEKIPYLKDLNIRAIYLNPIFESSENHRYSTGNFFKIDPLLGNNKYFKNFTDQLKENNIGLILDGVFSHTGSDSIYFNKFNYYESLGAYQSIDSPYYNWFNFKDWPNTYDSWWGFDNLPTVDKNNQDYIDFITGESGVLSYWAKMGIAGWRLDVIDEFPDHFIDLLRSRVKAENEDHLIIGEVWEDASTKVSYGQRKSYLLGRELDSVMNYPWKNAILDFVKNKNSIEFRYNIESLLENYPRQSIDTAMNILSTHDTERALLTLAIDHNKVDPEDIVDFKLTKQEYEKGKNLLKIASFIQFSLPGIPCIYYGDEIGMYGFSDPFNRQCFDWDNIDYDLLDHYTTLSEFRTKYKKEFLGDFYFMLADQECLVYALGNLIFIVNTNKKPVFTYKLNYSTTNGKTILGNDSIIMTKLGGVIPPKSLIVVERRPNGQ